MVNKIFHIPNLRIASLQGSNLEVKKLFGLTCFMVEERNRKTVYHSLTDDLCKDITIRVFEIAKILKEAGRFAGNQNGIYRGYEEEKICFSDESYFKWANIDKEYQDVLMQYTEKFISDFGLLQIWPKIDKIFPTYNSELIKIFEQVEGGGFISVDKGWAYHNELDSYEVEPLIFILEYISILYMHHTQKEYPYTFDVDINCKVSYLMDGHSISFEGAGLHLLIDLAYLHTVADPDQEFRQCEREGCPTMFYADRVKNKRFCTTKCKNKFNIRQTRRKALKEKLLQKYKTINQDWLIKQIDFLFEQGISGDKKIEKNLEELIKESGKEG